jgi:hypothetical protein
MHGPTSDTIGCVSKLMSNQELIVVRQKILNVPPSWNDVVRYPSIGSLLVATLSSKRIATLAATRGCELATARTDVPS